MASRKMLIIGLDGASFPIIDVLIKEGKLENFRYLREMGVYGVLESTIPPITFPAIPSFITGKNPGKHGVSSFFRPKMDRSLGLVSSKSITDEFWNIGLMNNLKKVIINLPLTYPAKPINGFIITGPLTPDITDQNMVYPFEKTEKYKHLLNDYLIDLSFQYVKGEEKRFFNECLEVMQNRLSISKKILRGEKWQLGIVYFTFLDRIQHSLFDLGSGPWLKKAYIAVDEIIGDYLEMVNDNTDFIVFSDHGFGPSKGRFHPNGWLEANGFLSYQRGTKKRSLSTFARKQQSNEILAWLFRKIPKAIKEKIIHRIGNDSSSFDMGKIDWDKSKAYSTINGIYVTTEDEEEKKQTIYEIISRMKSISDPISGYRLRINVQKKEQVYFGEYIEKMPDILYEIEDYSYEPFATFDVVKPIHKFNNMNKGWHRKNGIYYIKGKEIKKGKRLDSRIIDLAPTILHLFSSKIPSYMDGVVIKEIFEYGSESYIRNVSFDTCKQDEIIRLKSAVKGLEVRKL